jgi:hypothetical protein
VTEHVPRNLVWSLRENRSTIQVWALTEPDRASRMHLRAEVLYNPRHDERHCVSVWAGLTDENPLSWKQMCTYPPDTPLVKVQEGVMAMVLLGLDTGP